MAQMTETLARDELRRIEAGYHPMFTRHEIEQLLRGWLEREDMRKDAERYRWLRDVGDETWVPLGGRPGVNFTHEIDAAIDAAIGRAGRAGAA